MAIQPLWNDPATTRTIGSSKPCLFRKAPILRRKFDVCPVVWGDSRELSIINTSIVDRQSGVEMTAASLAAGRTKHQTACHRRSLMLAQAAHVRLSLTSPFRGTSVLSVIFMEKSRLRLPNVSLSQS